MFTARKKIQPSIKGRKVTPFEQQVAQALFDLEANSSELKTELRELHILAAKEVTTADGAKSIVIFVPFTLLKSFHRIQTRLVRELEKKFSGRHVVIVAQRRILRKPGKNNRKSLQKRPRSRTLTAVHDAVLEDVVYPTEIVGKRTRVRLDGSRLLKVYLDRKDQQNTEYKLDTFATVYRKLTGKQVVFQYPPQQQE
eukprot:TRINITY_DN3751_c0_g1_i1.p1 TRINITY_DN3751_c0_g1~~TRINITY_DN3751_c0_g1_i1.p1  ORF type:complete len:197 (-),score=70.54 TRINITY_DN3751_c0_g1_i1:53-643(-)